MRVDAGMPVLSPGRRVSDDLFPVPVFSWSILQRGRVFAGVGGGGKRRRYRPRESRMTRGEQERAPREPAVGGGTRARAGERPFCSRLTTTPPSSSRAGTFHLPGRVLQLLPSRVFERR